MIISALKKCILITLTEWVRFLEEKERNNNHENPVSLNDVIQEIFIEHLLCSMHNIGH